MVEDDCLDFDTICRICLQETDLVHISACFYAGSNISLLLTQYSDISLQLPTEEKHLPQKICHKCLQALVQAHRFISKCNLSNRILRELASLPAHPHSSVQLKRLIVLKKKTIDSDFSEQVHSPLKSQKTTNSEFNKQESILITQESTDTLISSTTDVPIIHKKIPKSRECKLCGKIFTRPNILRDHMRTHTLVNPYECNLCGKKFRYQTNLTRHQDLHTGIKNHICECGKAFTQKAGLEKHKLTHIYEDVECELCGVVTKSRAAHDYHMLKHRQAAEQVGELECEICKRKYESKLTLKQHMSNIHKVRSYLCSLCGKHFKNASTYFRHKRMHEGMRPYPCRHCERTFTNQAGRQNHEATHDITTRHICEICNKEFTTLRYLKRHQWKNKDCAPMSNCNNFSFE